MRITRRTMLRGLLGGAAVTIGLPPLELLMNRHGTAYASDGTDGFPKRFGLFFWGNGVLPERWVPAAQGTEWALSDQLAPLAPFRAKVSVVSGTRVEIPNTEPHWATACGILTGGPLVKSGNDTTFGGPTIDQIIAQAIGADTRFQSLEVGTRPGGGISHNGPNSVNPAEESPIAAFERVFGGSFTLPGAEPVVDPRLALDRSVLDAVMGDITALKASVGAADKVRLDQHFEGVRALEKRLAKLAEHPPELAACAYPTTPAADYPDIDGRPQLQERNRAMAEIVAMAVACDQTRVFSNLFTRPVNNNLFAGATAGHHQLTHDEPGDQPEVHAITVQCMEALAAQLEALDRVNEGAGTLLDHCLVLGTTDVSLAKTHSPEDFPVVLAGSAGGALRTGVHYRSPSGENASKVLLTVARAMGLDLAELGSEQGHVTDGIGEIEA